MAGLNLITIAEACRRLGICRATLYNWVRAGKLDLVRLADRSGVSAPAVRAILSRRDRQRPPSVTQRAWRELAARGVVDPSSRAAFFRPRLSPGAPIPMKGKPLSEIIMEERGER